MGISGKTFRGVVVPGRGLGAQRMANPSLLHARSVLLLSLWCLGRSTSVCPSPLMAR